MRRTKTIFWVIRVAGLCGALAIASRAAHAESDADAQVPTFSLNASGGYSVYKSGMVASNDTGTTVGYGLSAYAGKDHQLGFLFRREQSAFSFALNKSQIAVSWQDFVMRYRLGPFYLGGTLSTSTWIVTRPPDANGDGKPDDVADPEAFLNVVTSGYGGNGGLFYAINKRSNVYADVLYSLTNSVQEKSVKDSGGTAILDRTITFGPRMDVDVGGTLILTKWLDLNAGFKMRTYQVTVDAGTFKEQLNTTYLGVAATANF